MFILSLESGCSWVIKNDFNCFKQELIHEYQIERERVILNVQMYMSDCVKFKVQLNVIYIKIACIMSFKFDTSFNIQYRKIYCEHT